MLPGITHQVNLDMGSLQKGFSLNWRAEVIKETIDRTDIFSAIFTVWQFFF